MRKEIFFGRMGFSFFEGDFSKIRLKKDRNANAFLSLRLRSL